MLNDSSSGFEVSKSSAPGGLPDFIQNCLVGRRQAEDKVDLPVVFWEKGVGHPCEYHFLVESNR